MAARLNDRAQVLALAVLGIGLLVIVAYLVVPPSGPSSWREPDNAPAPDDAGAAARSLDRIEAEPVTASELAAEARRARVRELRRRIEDATERGDEAELARLRAELERAEAE